MAKKFDKSKLVLRNTAEKTGTNSNTQKKKKFDKSKLVLGENTAGQRQLEAQITSRINRYSDFSDRYNNWISDADSYLSRTDTETPDPTQLQYGEYNTTRSSKSNDPRWAWDADSFALSADRATGAFKDEAAKLLKDLENDRQYMTDEGYTAYKDFLSAVSAGDYAEVTKALKGEAIMRSSFGSEENYKKAVAERERNERLGINSGTTYRDLMEMLWKDPLLSEEDEKYIKELAASRPFVYTMTADDVRAKMSTEEQMSRLSSPYMKAKSESSPYAYYDDYGNPVTWEEFLEILETEDFIDTVFQAEWDSQNEDWKRINDMAGVELPDTAVTGYTRDDRLKLEKIYRDSPELVSDLIDGGVEAAYKKTATYFDYLDAKEQASKQREKDIEWAKENPVLATLANFGNAPAQILDYAGNLISGDTSELGRRRDVYNDKHVNRLQAYNEGATTAIDDSIDNEFLSWLATTAYSGVTSAAQSTITTLAATAVFGPQAGPTISRALLGSQAAASSYNQAIKNGSTYGEAFSFSVAAGVAEVLMEGLPMDNLLKNIKNFSKGTFKEMLISGLKNTAYQALIEGGEELGTAVIDEIADRVINGDKSQYNANIDRYMRFDDMTRAEAEKKASEDYIMEVIESVVGGMIGGATSGGTVEIGKGVMTGVQSIAQNKKTSYRLTEDDLQDYLDAGGRLNKSKKKVLDEGGKIILTSENEIVSYINEAISSPKKLNTVAYGKVNEELSRDVAEYSNGKINIEGSYLELVPYDINHAYRGHLKAKQEGDIDLTLEDFEKIPDYIDNYDDLVYAIKYKNGDTRVCLSKEIENGRVVIIEAVSKSRGSLQFKNMIGVSHEKYIEDYENRYKKRNSTNTRGDQGHNISPRDATVSTDSISENGEIVNSTVKDFSVNGTNTVQKADKIGDNTATEPDLIDAVEGDSGSLEAASKKYGAQAGAMTAVYRQGQDVAKFDNAFRNAYNMGLAGVPLSYTMDSSATSYLSETQRENAWIIGQDSAEFSSRTQDDSIKKGAKDGVRKKGFVRGDGVTLDELRAELNDTQNTALGLLRTYAEATGINIVLYKSEVNENGEFVGAQGKFDLSEDTIYIDINAGLFRVKTDKLSLSQYTMMRTFSHEFVHFCEKWNPVQYNEFRRLVFDRLTKQGVDVDELILIKQEQYGDISYDSASREVMAEAMVDILPDSHFMEELSQKHKNIYTKLIQKLKDFLSTLKAHFNSLTKSTDRGAAALKEQVGKDVRYFEDIVRAYDKMALTAVENYQTLALENSVEETKDLIALHNITASQLTEALENGGIAGPSISINQRGISKFGEISVVLTKESIDPNVNAENRLYGSDAWTPNQATLKKNAVFDESKLTDSINEVQNILGEHSAELFGMTSAQVQDALAQAKGDLHAAFDGNIGLQTAYALKEGIIDAIPENSDGSVDIEQLHKDLKALSSGTGVVWGKYRRQFVEFLIDSAITSYDAATADETVSVMREKADTAKKFKLSEDGTLTVPAARYRSVDALKANKGRLSENADKAAAEMGKKFLDCANKIAANSATTTKAVVDAINRAYELRYRSEGIVASFAEDGIIITQNEVQTLRNLYKNAVELPAEYFEAKAMRVVPLSEAAAVVAPQRFIENNPDMVEALSEMGVEVVSYKDGSDSSRLEKLNSLEGVKFQKRNTKNTAEDGGVQYSFRTSQSGMANDALIPYSEELTNLINQKGGIIVDSYQKLVDTVNLAFDEPNHKATVYFGTIPADVIDNIESSIPNMPTDFDGHIFKKNKVYSIAATLDSIRHIVDDKNGLTRTDVIEYLDRLADTIIDFDSVAFDYYTDSMGNRIPGVLFKKQFPDGRLQTFDIVSHGQRSLKLQTVYLEKAAYNANKKKAATALPLNNTTAHTPKARASQPSNNSLSKQNRIVNSNSQNSVSSVASSSQTDPNAGPNQHRTEALSDREILYRAAEGLNALELSEGEKSALDIFRKHLDELDELQRQRDEQGQLYREQMFTKGGDRAAAQKTRNRMQTLDAQIKRANEKLLSIEDKAVLQKVLSGARKVVEAEGRAKTKEILRRAKDRRDNGADIKKYRSRIERDSKNLSDWILKPNNKDISKHVPEVLREAVIPFLQSIDFTSKRQLRGGEATKADAEFAKRLRALDKAIRENVSPEGLYSGYIDLPPYFLGMLDACKSNIADIIGENNGSFVINQMTSEELKNLSEVVKTLKKAIVEFNKFHSNAMFQHVFEAGDDSIDFMQTLNKNTEGVIASKVSDFLKWKQMRPSYAFERFGEGGKAVYDGLRRGQARLAFNTKKIIDFSEKAYTEKEVKDWEKEIHEFELGGDTVNMPVSFIMGLREIIKRGQGQGHVFGNGIRVATFTRDGKKISDSGHLITEKEAAEICSVLTDRQKEVADSLQHFMAETGGKWGNEISVARYGEKLFGEENYYPLSSDGRQLPATAEETPDSQGLYALLNMGFTKELTENASNRVIVYSIFDVFANHMASMAQYNALALPVLDTIKWFNYKQKTELEDGTVIEGASVREEMARAYGSPVETTPGKGKPGYAESFVTNIIRSFSGTEAQGVSTDSIGLKALKRYNVAQVAYNARVVIQQPMAITRAALLLDYRSIIRGLKLKPKVIQKNIREMRQYSGIALWKDLGFYDVNISRGVTDLIKHDSSVMDKITDVGMFGAGAADTLTWAAIWCATKEQVIKDQGLKPGDDGFFEAVTTLFEDVIYKTQVVDSVLTKNEYLRSKGLFARATGSFMSEPTTSASMLISAVEKVQLDMQRGIDFSKAWKKNGKLIGRTFLVYGVGQVLLAAAQAVADAWRDDDEYEEFNEKWVEAFFGNLVDELMPFNKLPIIGDFYDLAKEVLAKFTDLEIYGNPPSSIYMQWYDYVVKGSEILADKIFGEDTNYTWYAAIYKTLQAASGMTGLPLAATTRELVSAWNNIVGYMAPSLKLKSYDAGEVNEIKYAYQDGYLTKEEATELLLSKGEAEDANEAYFTIQSWDSDGDYSRFASVYDAVYNGKKTDEAMKDLLDHGYTEKEITSRVTTQIGKWYYDDESDRRISKAEAIKMLKEYTDLSDEEITDKVNRWTCKVATGIAYDDIKDEFISGNLSKKRACEMYSVYGGMSKDEAKEKVEEIEYIADFEKEYPKAEGVSYKRAKLYREYGESAGIDIGTFLEAVEFKSESKSDRDEDGDVILAAKDKVIDYIDGLKLSDEQKDALYLACDYAESGLWKTPWN